MAGYKNFQSTNMKNTRSRDLDNPEHNPTVRPAGKKKKGMFLKNIDTWADLISYFRWFPDAYLDLIAPDSGGIKLHFDQRVYLRVISRFYSLYAVFSRGYSKTYLEVLAQMLVCIFYPNVTLSMTAQTKEGAAKILKDKYKEIIRHFPMIENEISGTPNFSKNTAEIRFKNGSVLDILANQYSSEGQRRSRIMAEESNLIDGKIFEKAIAPITEIKRITNGDMGISDPQEVHHQICFFTTSGFRNSYAFNQINKMTDDMIMMNGTGSIVLTASWQLPCYMGRGRSKQKILEKKSSSNPVSFAQNYESKWVGASDGALATQDQLMAIRTLKNPEYQSDGESEYYIGVDVARSGDKRNAATVAVVGKVLRRENNRVRKIQIVNIFVIDSSKKFPEQAKEIKEIKNKFNAITVAVDSNGLGAGLIDALTEEQWGDDGESLGSWNPFNNPNIDASSEIHEDCLYDLKVQNANEKSVTNFVGAVQSKKLELLEFKQESDYYSYEDMHEFLPYLQTNYLIDEISNLKLTETEKTKKTTTERLTKSISRDKFSALSYLIFYIMEYEDIEINTNTNYKSYLSALSSR